MPQKFQQKTQKQAEKAKSCMKVQNEKEINQSRQNVLKSQTKPKKHNCKNFVILNKRKTFEKFNEKMFKNIKEFGNQGFILNRF